MKQHLCIEKTQVNRGALDYSHLLDAPAGKHGFVEARHGHLYFEDGTRARFFGFNIATRSNTPDHATAERLAAHFASMGVNIIRLHAVDAPIGEEPASWSSCPEAPLIDYPAGDSRHFTAEGLDRFEYLIAQLEQRGIYLHIDLIVARQFVEGDGLEYPGGAPSCIKRYCLYNDRLIELQKEYAKQLLCHVNPYTGRALIDDPAVVTVQINNEDTAIKGNMGGDAGEEMKPYREEVQRRFNNFLLAKYHTREKLAAAWTRDGVCALGADEDPAQGTVRGIEGSFYQPVNDPNGPWDAPEGPARYADFMEFGIWMNRKFYQDMKDYLRALGVRVPIVTSNLIAGAADVYSHTDGDIMENNCYFNHPLMPVQGNTYLVAGPAELVSANPLTMQRGIGSMATTLVSLAAVAAVRDKPFIISEWNEYGLHPFHSTALVQTAAYACLNDWDGLILYNHHTSEKADDQPGDVIGSVFDAFNDPAVACQWGFAASMFLKGLVREARHCVDVVYTQNDLRTLPNFHSMPMTFLPYVTGMRNVFLDGGETYEGNADVAVNAGFVNCGNLKDARHAVYYAWNNCRDAMRRYPDANRLPLAAKDTAETEPGVHLGRQALVFDDIAKTAENGDYRHLADILTAAMHQWGALPETAGYVDGKLVSDTGELVFDPDHARFTVRTPTCGYFSGAPEASVVLSGRVRVEAKNERLSLALVAKDEAPLDGAQELVLTAMGTTGADGTTMGPGPNMMGIPFTAVTFGGKLFAETLEGTLYVKARRALLEILDPAGAVLATLAGQEAGDEVAFALDGTVPGIQYHLTIEA